MPPLHSIQASAPTPRLVAPLKFSEITGVPEMLSRHRRFRRTASARAQAVPLRRSRAWRRNARSCEILPQLTGRCGDLQRGLEEAHRDRQVQAVIAEPDGRCLNDECRDLSTIHPVRACALLRSFECSVMVKADSMTESSISLVCTARLWLPRVAPKWASSRSHPIPGGAVLGSYRRARAL